MARPEVLTFQGDEVTERLRRHIRRMSPTNRRAILSLLDRLSDRLDEQRNGEIEIRLYIKSGSIAQNYEYRDNERVQF